MGFAQPLAQLPGERRGWPPTAPAAARGGRGMWRAAAKASSCSARGPAMCSPRALGKTRNCEKEHGSLPAGTTASSAPRSQRFIPECGSIGADSPPASIPNRCCRRTWSGPGHPQPRLSPPGTQRGECSLQGVIWGAEIPSGVRVGFTPTGCTLAPSACRPVPVPFPAPGPSAAGLEPALGTQNPRAPLIPSGFPDATFPLQEVTVLVHPPLWGQAAQVSTRRPPSPSPGDLLNFLKPPRFWPSAMAVLRGPGGTSL